MRFEPLGEGDTTGQVSEGRWDGYRHPLLHPAHPYMPVRALWPRQHPAGAGVSLAVDSMAAPQHPVILSPGPGFGGADGACVTLLSLITSRRAL